MKLPARFFFAASIAAIAVLAGCSPSTSPGSETSVVSSSTLAADAAATVQPLDAATIENVATEDKLTSVYMVLSAQRTDFTPAAAQAVKQMASQIQAGKLAVGSDQIGVSVQANGDLDYTLSLKYSATALKNMDLSKASDAQVLEASEDAIFSDKSAAAAGGWCLAFASAAPKFCKLAH